MNQIIKKIIICSAFVFSSSVGLCDKKTAPADHEFSLREAIQTAFDNNKNLQIQAKEVEAARAMIAGAHSKFLPNVSVNAGYTHNSYILNLGSSGKKDKGILTGYVDDNKAGVSVGQTVYNGGADIAAYRQAKKNFEIQGQILRAQKAHVAFEVKRLYYGLLLAQETQRIAQNLVDLAQAHYEETQKKFDAGIVSKFDTLQSKVQVSKNTPELIRAKSAAELIEAELKRLLNVNIGAPIHLMDKLSFVPAEIAEDQFVRLSLLNNPELTAASLGVDARQLGIELAKAGGNPQVTVGGGVHFRSNDVGDMFNNRHENWTAGFSVTMPVFDGFSSKAKVEEAKARYAQTILGKEDLADQLVVEVKRGCLDLKKAEALIHSQKDNIEQAKDALRIAQVRYENGEGTNLDVLEAQVSLSQVEKNYSDGIYEYLMAGAYLERLSGAELKEAPLP